MKVWKCVLFHSAFGSQSVAGISLLHVDLVVSSEMAPLLRCCWQLEVLIHVKGGKF